MSLDDRTDTMTAVAHEIDGPHSNTSRSELPNKKRPAFSVVVALAELADRPRFAPGATRRRLRVTG
jgi:hypothetical protein